MLYLRGITTRRRMWNPFRPRNVPAQVLQPEGRLEACEAAVARLARRVAAQEAGETEREATVAAALDGMRRIVKRLEQRDREAIVAAAEAPQKAPPAGNPASEPEPSILFQHKRRA